MCVCFQELWPFTFRISFQWNGNHVMLTPLILLNGNGIHSNFAENRKVSIGEIICVHGFYQELWHFTLIISVQ